MNIVKTVVIASIVAMSAMATAQAATTWSNSKKYFDENGNLVGQQILLCNNQANHAGNIHTAYYIQEQTNCSGTFPPEPIVSGTQVTNYTLPSFLTISAACQIAECIPAGTPEPKMLTDQSWTWITGWQ